jgi:hypothetical protein
MTPSQLDEHQPSTAVLCNMSAEQRTLLLFVAVTCMACFAVPWLAVNVVKLLWEQPPWGAVDLKLRYHEVQLWFGGRPIYSGQSQAMHAVYPPASYTLLWPLLGWPTFTLAKAVWATTMGAALAWLAALFVKASGAQTRLERLFVILMLLSLYATGFTIGHGQLTIFALYGLVAGLTLMAREQRTWRDDLLVAALMLGALVKPTLSVPFFWLVLFLPGTWRPALFILLGYIALTALALSFQEFDLWRLLHSWLARSLEGVAREAAGGYGNLHSWLAVVGLQRWNLPLSLLMLLALGLWTYQHRHGDLWLLLGVTAIVTRLWVYHRSYDDMLVLLPMITLFRIAKVGRSENGYYEVVAALLLAMAVMAMFVPALILVVPAWKPLLKTSQTPILLLMLLFLLYWGWDRQRSRLGDSEASYVRAGH